MEILFEGLKPENRTYIASCSNCGTKIKFFKHEAKVTDDFRDGAYVSVDCPTCGHVISKQADKYEEKNPYNEIYAPGTR